MKIDVGNNAMVPVSKLKQGDTFKTDTQYWMVLSDSRIVNLESGYVQPVLNLLELVKPIKLKVVEDV